MNNQAVAINFSAVLMPLYITISPVKASNENRNSRAEMNVYRESVDGGNFIVIMALQVHLTVFILTR